MTQLYNDFINNKNNDWTKLRGIKLYQFMGWLVKNNKIDWVKKLRQKIAKRLESKGLVFFDGLGWVYPEEVESSGLSKYISNHINDLDKFKAYRSYKKDQETRDFVEEKKQEFKQKINQEEEDYLKNLVEGEQNDLF